jgi:hypothetical protein
MSCRFFSSINVKPPLIDVLPQMMAFTSGFVTAPRETFLPSHFIGPGLNRVNLQHYYLSQVSTETVPLPVQGRLKL